MTPEAHASGDVDQIQGTTYGGFGKLLTRTCYGTPLSLNVDGNTNRVNGQLYDANGNWLGESGQPQMVYDIENRLAETPGGEEKYKYSVSGHRIMVQSGTTYRYHLYGIDGQLLGVYRPEWKPGANYCAKEDILRRRTYFGGRLLYYGENPTLNGAVVLDRLGTAGTNYPYGGATLQVDHKVGFATYTRDASGLDYAVNRYYKSSWGRFTTADPYQASGGPADPQSWNLYSYVGGDPVNYSDPSGLASCSTAWGYYYNGPTPVSALFTCSSGGYELSTFALFFPYLSGYTGYLAQVQESVYRNLSNSVDALAGQGDKAVSNANIALNSIILKNNWSVDCAEMLFAAGSNVTVNSLKRAAYEAVVLDGRLATDVRESDLYANSPLLAASAAADPKKQRSIASIMWNNPTTVHAMAALMSNVVYINPTYFAAASTSQLMATMAHELIHNLTELTDEDIKRLWMRWGTNPATPGSGDITAALANYCF